MEYRTSSHTKYKIDYHCVWATKYRYKILMGDLALRVRELIQQTCEHLEIRIIRGVVNKDHIHILVSTPTNLSPPEIMRRVKGRIFNKLFKNFLRSKRVI